MTNVTFSVDDDLHKRMKEHPEINWTIILRQSILDHLEKVEGKDLVSIEEFRENLPHKTLKMINDLEGKKEIEFYEKTKKMERERLEKQQTLEQG